MKLKEKLAKEYTNDGYYGCDTSFIAGFETAREMALKISCDHALEGAFEVSKGIRVMGEEELE